MNLSLCLFINLYLCLSAFSLLSVCLSVYLFVHPSVCVYICRPVYMSVFSLCQFICLSFCLFIHVVVNLSICQPVYMSVYLFVCSICLSVCLGLQTEMSSRNISCLCSLICSFLKHQEKPSGETQRCSNKTVNSVQSPEPQESKHWEHVPDSRRLNSLVSVLLRDCPTWRPRSWRRLQRWRWGFGL